MSASPLAGSRNLPGGPAAASTKPVSRIQIPPARRFLDGAFYGLVMLCALGLIAAVGFIVFELITHSAISIREFGFKFFVGANWDPVALDFGALPFVFGTLVSSCVALLMAVPLAVGVAVYTTEICPRPLRGPISFCTELLAAIPSVIYGMWGMFVLVPALRVHVDPLLIKWLGWTGVFAGPSYGVSVFSASVILAIMIIPIVSSITREILITVPRQQREAVLALGATRWEMIRMGVLRNARVGIFGAVMLGLGRALGETMAVTMVIGNTPQIAKSLLAPGHTMASVLANEFTEAANPMYLSALVEIGLALFMVTIVVNGAARALVWIVTRGTPARAHA